MRRKLLILIMISMHLTTPLLAKKTIKHHIYKEGFKISINHSNWRVSTYPSSKFGVAFTAYPRKKRDSVNYFAVTVKPTVSKTNIKNLCSQNKMFIEKMTKQKVKASIRKKQKNSVCYLDYLSKKTEQYLFKTKKNYIVIVTVENKKTKYKNASKIFKLFSLTKK